MIGLVCSACWLAQSHGADWSRFRGPNGLGVSTDAKAPPTEWSETKNLKWKVALPGPGLSSPIVVGNRIFVTCWSGYGVSRSQPGDIKQLKRHLVCVDRQTGKVNWDVTVDPVLPEENFNGMFAENGYASHTPVSDGERVYTFFGKTGVIAFDLDGKQLWKTSVGTDDDQRSWGTASSPILYKHLVIVPATIESQALVALDKSTGAEMWRQKAEGFASTWGTPVLVDLPEGRQDLVLAVPFEIWGFNPDTGKLRWFCETLDADSMRSSIVAHDGIVYAMDGRSGTRTAAVRAGGKDDVTKTHLEWTGSEGGGVGTPIYHDGCLYSINGGIAICIDTKTGKRVYQERLAAGASEPANSGPPRGGPPGGPGGRGPGPGGFGPGGPGGGRGGFGGGTGGQDYSSPVVAGGKLYYIRRTGESYVVALGREFKLLANNRFESDKSNYSATPAIADGALFIRSNTHLYCVSE